MSLTFWDTIRGARLAETLTRELPKLTKQRKQYTESMANEKVQSFLEERIAAGDRYISHFTYGAFTTVIMEQN